MTMGSIGVYLRPHKFGKAGGRSSRGAAVPLWLGKEVRYCGQQPEGS